MALVSNRHRHDGKVVDPAVGPLGQKTELIGCLESDTEQPPWPKRQENIQRKKHFPVRGRVPQLRQADQPPMETVSRPRYRRRHSMASTCFNSFCGSLIRSSGSTWSVRTKPAVSRMSMKYRWSSVKLSTYHHLGSGGAPAPLRYGSTSRSLWVSQMVLKITARERRV